MDPEERRPGGYPLPRWRDPDLADVIDAADDAHREAFEWDRLELPDIEWSSMEQTFLREFAATAAFRGSR